ncbi:run domain Beclin-1-interacting and cysteine-rich domain-containing protein [Phlebotomus argentipes]|uniref:run domain Beclin-1-interacting and cysteine-rich domain-containing protein n=1 Tax=Phlebotomus argentipes TaxID=94469 RepID=UPI002892FA47|nr:run domain Beclin-1-interacting and cysteine-rich domain-containing protein [Phlebotomus argentipes]
MADNGAGIPSGSRVHTRCDHTKLLSDVRDAILGGFQRHGEIVSEMERFPRLLQAMEAILVHGMRISKPDGSPDLWRFIEALSWLNPSMAVSVAHTSNLSPVHIPHSRIKSNRALAWLYECLKGHTLSVKLSWLLSDFEHLSNCYEATAFLRSEKFARGLFLCLEAVESGHIDAIEAIDPSLLVDGATSHRRSSSHPEFPSKMGNKPSLKVNYDSPEDFDTAEATEEPVARPKTVRTRKKSKKSRQRKSRKSRLKASSSLPNIAALEREPRARSMTITQPISIPYKPVRLTAESLEQNAQKIVPSFSYKTSRDAGSDCGGSASRILEKSTPTDLMPIQLVKCDDIKIHFDKRFTPKTPASASDASPAVQVPEVPEASSSSVNTPTQRNLFSVLTTKKSLYPYLDVTLEKGESSGSNGTPFQSNLYASPSPGDFMNNFIPLPGEKIRNRYRKTSLLEGLSSSPLGITPTTSRTEQGSRQPTRGQSLASYLQSAQFSQTNSDLERENAHFSVSDAMIAAIEQLKWTKIEKDESRVGEKMRSVRVRSRLKRWDGEANGRVAGTSSSPDNACSSTESSEVSLENLSIFNESNSSDDMRLSESSQNTNDHVAYAEWGENTLEALSAEGVALSLISKFSDKQLPRASELLWMSPDNEPMSPQTPGVAHNSLNGGHTDRFRMNSVLRGTKDWAPPRAQIIFTRHASPNRKELITQQNFRCAGCGMRVAKAYAHKLRYCAYIGKYHCTGCHRNQISAIPARVLERWDFSCHPVSVFSYRLLDQIWSFPLFRIPDLNPQLYEKVRMLNLARLKRSQLKFIEDFIRSCRFAMQVQKLFENIPNHLTMDIDVWSMMDLVAVKNGSFKRDVSLFIEKCEEHILSCELCTARGFFCELCTKKSVIFPWQPNIRRCGECGTCVHDNCWRGECPKCRRLKQRRRGEGTKSTSG